MGEAPRLRELEAAKAAELMRETGARPTAIQDEPLFLAWLGGRRERQKKTGGSRPPDPRPARGRPPPPRDGALSRTGRLILLASDGFSALVDLYRAIPTPRASMEAARTSVWSPGRQAREIETEQDPDGNSFRASRSATTRRLCCFGLERPDRHRSATLPMRK